MGRLCVLWLAVAVTAYEQSCTGMLRVCRDGELATPDKPCKPNVLGRHTIRQSVGNWWSSVYETWISEIILSEVMQTPVELVSDPGAGMNIDYYVRNTTYVCDSVD
jgi:hypothetical protein